MEYDHVFISNDPAENADNFNPEWAFLRKITTDGERYKAIRQRWGNTDVPDPKINLTYRHQASRTDAEAKENCFNPPEISQTTHLPSVTASRRKNRKASRRKSRSCTRPYEQLISNIQKNYELEYSWLIHRHTRELQEIQHLQSIETFLCSGQYNNLMMKEHFERQQLQVLHLLSNHHSEVQNFMKKKNESIDACKRFMEEVTAFFTFYQKINSDEVTLQMTDSQYEHAVETEKMYGLYEKFYRKSDS